MVRVLLSALAFTLAGCATVPSGGRAGDAPAGDVIAYETTPCHGFCPVYAVGIAANGKGVFSGTQHTAVVGDRAFAATPAQVAAFTAALAPYRPARGDVRFDSPEACGPRYATDMPGVIVTWSGGQKLFVDFGCDREKNRAMFAALKAAPDALPIAELIGKR